jgi:hypothetical protein
MLGDLSDWIFAALPWKVQVGCLVAALLVIGMLVFWASRG